MISEYTDQEKESKRLLQDAKYRLEKAQEDEKQASEKFEAIKLRVGSLVVVCWWWMFVGCLLGGGWFLGGVWVDFRLDIFEVWLG